MIRNAKLFGLFAMIFVVSACSEHTEISFICEKDAENNYVLKWEVFPEKDSARIEIFESDNDSVFSGDPVKVTYVNDYIAVLPSQKNKVREFFKLKIGRTTSSIISNRFFDLDGVQNFRDVGGYVTRANKQMRWGKIFRSGYLTNMSEADKDVLKGLGVKTVVDLRSNKHSSQKPKTGVFTNYITLPISVNNFNEEVKDQILEGRFLKGDAHIYTQDCYRILIDDYTAQLSAFFDILLDENNYPLVYHCGYGKDRTGIVTYLLLKALDVPTGVAEDDYLLSNNYIDRSLIISDKNRPDMPGSMKDAVMMLVTADLSQLRYAVSCMKKKSGSVDDYMLKELKLTHEKREKLKQILLYN
ncbi:tyrosine-protein phosphatase [Dysgonomonas sp. 216]|uniref:tyrosine-protein phosphatase n=1 Tax=Dysgonomonas sp. 216 TaxID=2302934 RepID=UPI0013D4F44F|nr:tyrosine-protein phosphatase [Dysgonomonas sp. 216]NDW17326.1 tyrosine-protein phosphatase [Dysgonomonas sp. 216]